MLQPLLKKIESFDILGLNPLPCFDRYSFRSKILGKEMTFGCLSFCPTETLCQNIVFLLHGGNGDDSQFVKEKVFESLDPVVVNRLWQKNTVIVMPLIEASFLHDHPTDPAKSYLNYFMSEIVDAICGPTQVLDLGFKVSPTACRFIAGISTGGQAALNCFFKNLEQFDGVGVHFPAILPFDYHDTQKAEDYLKTSGAIKGYLDVALYCHNAVFIDHDDFKKHDCLCLALQAETKALQSKKIYLDCGTKDEFGFFVGTALLSDYLKQKNVAHQWTLVPELKHDIDFVKKQFSMLIRALL